MADANQQNRAHRKPKEKKQRDPSCSLLKPNLCSYTECNSTKSKGAYFRQSGASTKAASSFWRYQGETLACSSRRQTARRSASSGSCSCWPAGSKLSGHIVRKSQLRRSPGRQNHFDQVFNPSLLQANS